MWNRPRLLNAIADLLILSTTAAALAGALVWLARVPSLPLRQVVFAQELLHTRRGEIEQVLPGVLKGNFFSVNLEEVRGELERLPWVRKVELRRVWPARLEVKVEEHRPAARWGEGRDELVNTFGEVFAATAPEADVAKLPLLYGPQGTAPEVLKRYGEFVGAFKTLEQKPVQVKLSPRLAWQVKLGNGMLVEMGREQQKSAVSVRLQRFVAFYPELVARYAVQPAVVDLRYPNGFAVRGAGEGKGN
jgi:cell division protein FtsQ